MGSSAAASVAPGYRFQAADRRDGGHGGNPEAQGWWNGVEGKSAAQFRPEAGAESQNIGPIVHPRIDD
jgi:hypothetical protein